MTDPRYAAPDVTSAADKPPTPPQTDPQTDPPTDPQTDPPTDAVAEAETDAGTDPSAAGVRDGVDTDSGHDSAAAAPDPQATTKLPRTGWDSVLEQPSQSQSASPSGSPSQSQSQSQYGAQSASTSSDDPDTQPAARPAAGPGWSTDETHDFPAYRPQSYPTYPPTLSQTSELPAVGAGGPPPTTAAAYGGPGPVAANPAAPGLTGPAVPGLTGPAVPGLTGPAAAGMTAYQPERPRRRAGAGLAGALGLIGIGAAAYGAFALPIQKLGPRRSPYFVSLRELSTQKVASSQANAHSVSFAGGHAATLWWRYGLAGALGVLALLLLVQICVPVLRRAAGVLLFLAGLATIVGYALAVHQTNDYRSIIGGAQGTHRLTLSQLGLGLWVAVAGCAIAAVGGLVAAAQSTRR